MDKITSTNLQPNYKNFEINAHHAGTIGDIIFSLHYVKRLAEYHNAQINFGLYTKDTWSRANDNSISINYYAFMRALLEQQPYIKSVYTAPENKFLGLDLREKLISTMKIGTTSWWAAGSFPYFFSKDCVNEQNGKFYIPKSVFSEQYVFLNKHERPILRPYVAICRTLRRQLNVEYTRIIFDLYQRYHRLYFIGTRKEYTTFVNKYGIMNKVKYVELTNALDIARFIYNAEFLVSNVTFAHALALGMQKRVYVEAADDGTIMRMIPYACQRNISQIGEVLL